MSVIGRLWRRAPAWRVSLVSAIALTGLAAMFPPAVPTLHWPWRMGASSGPAQASFQSTAQPAPSDETRFRLMPPGAVRTGFVAEAGRKVPLPAGDWQEVAVIDTPGTAQETVFARIIDHRLLGLVEITATGALGGIASPVGVPPACSDPARLTGMIVPALPSQSPLAHECFEILPVDMHRVASDPFEPIPPRLLDLLSKLNIAVHAAMLDVNFYRSTDSAWQQISVLVPDPGPGHPQTALRDWAERYQSLLHKSFDGTATPADLTKAAISIPE